MNVDIHDKVEKGEKPLTRADIERLLQDAGSSHKLDLRGHNLEGIDLTHFTLQGTNLSRANLSRVNLREADLRVADLSRADLTGADLTGAFLLEANLGGANLTGAIILEEPKVTTAESISELRIRITEEPLTAHNLATITSTLTQLHMQCWLIASNRFTDLIEYTQTCNLSFEEEANLTIAQMTHHAPAEITFNVNLESVANALKIAIDAVTGMWERKRELELKNTALEEEIWQEKQKVETTLDSERIAEQKALVELYDMQAEQRRKPFDLLEDVAKKASKIVEALRPDADATVKAMAANTLIKSLSQLAKSKGLELLPLSPSSGEKTVRPDTY
jgi:uncharacterized protein YjbI with pentapeptide repeats